MAAEDYGVEAVRCAVEEVTGDAAYAQQALRVREEIHEMPSADAVWAELVGDVSAGPIA